MRRLPFSNLGVYLAHVRFRQQRSQASLSSSNARQRTSLFQRGMPDGFACVPRCRCPPCHKEFFSKTQPFAFQGDLSATAGPRKRIGSAKLKPASTETLDRVSPPPHRVVRRQPTIGDAHDGREDGGKRVLGSSRARGVVGSVPGLAAVGDRCPACDGELRKLTIIFPVRCAHERFGVRLLPPACAVLRQSYIPTQCRSKRR